MKMAPLEPFNPTTLLCDHETMNDFQNTMSRLINLCADAVRILVENIVIPKERRQVKFPRSKRKRIIKKWARKESSYEYFKRAFLIDEERIKFKVESPPLFPYKCEDKWVPLTEYGMVGMNSLVNRGIITANV